MKKALFLLYAWGSTFLFAIIIYWLATVPNLAGDEPADELVKVVFRMTLYSILFILVYRSLIITLKNTVSRLSAWRSKREEIEDAEFVLIIETLMVIVTILTTLLFSIFEEYTQAFVEGRMADPKDVLISTMAILVTAIVVYAMPVIGELEMAVKHKIEDHKKSSSKKNSKE